MSGRGRARRGKQPESVIVVAGEDRNDRESLKRLLEERYPELRGRILQINDPVALHRAPTAGELAERVRKVVGKARGVAEAKGEGTLVACLYVHEDLDLPDGPAYLKAHRRVEQEIHRQLGRGHYVLAVSEMEAWMLLFPEALPSVVKVWKVPTKYRGRDTGRFPDPKAILMKEVSGTKGRRYKESDAPAVFDAIVEGEHLEKPEGTNRFWDRFRQDVELCGQEHLQG